MVVDGNVHVVSRPVQLQVQGDGSAHDPVPFEHLAVEVDPAHVGGPQLVPAQVVRIDEQGAVGLLVADVAGDVLLVAFPVEGPGQNGELRPRRKGGDELVGGGLKPDVDTHLFALLGPAVASDADVHCTGNQLTAAVESPHAGSQSGGEFEDVCLECCQVSRS